MTAYKFTTLAPNGIVKPTEVWGVNRPLSANDYAESKVDDYGVFTVDATKMRKLHSFDSYQASTGNILQQTSLDGTISSYEWYANNSLVRFHTANPGSQQHRSFFDYKSLVGLTTTVDPNGMSAGFEYDAFNRLKIVKDHNGHIVSRHRYHFSSQDESFTASLSFAGNPVAGMLTTITTTLKQTEYGQTSYSWDFGDGTSTTTTTNTVSHAFPFSNTYRVTVTISNPDNGSASASSTVFISPPLTTSLCADGPVEGNRCVPNEMIYGTCTISQSPSNDTILKLTASDGCPGNYSYVWKYFDNTLQQDITFGSNSTEVVFPHREGQYSIVCTITDSCGNISYQNIDLNLTESCN